MDFSTVAACGKCCCQSDGELEVKQPGKQIGAPFFQGPLEVSVETDTTSVPQTSAPAAVEEMAAVAESRRSRDNAVPPATVADPLPAPEQPQKRCVDSEPEPLVFGEPRPARTEPRRTFEAVISKGERKLGIDINLHNSVTLLVTKVNDGPVMDHNHAHPGEAILPGDRVVELNGVRGNTKLMLASCIGVAELHFVVATGLEWTARVDALDKAEQRLGIVVHLVDLVSLVVSRLDEEGHAAQKAAVDPDFDLRADDRIVAINDVRLDASALRRELETATSWTITWRRMVMDDK